MKNDSIMIRKKQLKSVTSIYSLDVHTNSIYVYGINLKTGEILEDCNTTGGCKAVMKRLRKHTPPTQTLVVYEAGPLGYGPYRVFRNHCFKCSVISPASIPQRAAGQKTDRDDAINNLNYFLSGLLNTVWVPDEYDESVRDLLRYRFFEVRKIAKVKQKITSFVKTKGQIYTQTKSRWCKTHYTWLEKLSLPDPSRTVLDLYLQDLEHQTQHLHTIDEQLAGIFSSQRYQGIYGFLQLIKGVGKVNAMTLISEFGDLTRFRHPRQVMKYLGLVPRKHASGQHDPHLSITKAGNKYLRTACVGIAKQYRDRRLLYSAKQLEKFPPVLGHALTKIQNRLFTKYKHLTRDLKKPANVARVAVARELCGFLWNLVVNIRPQLIHLEKQQNQSKQAA